MPEPAPEPVDAVDWDLTLRVAGRVGGTEPLAESYLAHSLAPDFTELTPRAEQLVEIETGLRSTAGPARARVIDRRQWVEANISSFQRLLRPIAGKLAARSGRGGFGPVTRKLAAVEMGTVLGWMSKRVLGQYDLLIVEEENPDDQDLVYFVGPNILAIEKRFAFPPREFRLWLAVHELTHRAQFTGVPWMRPYFLDQVGSILDAVDPDPEQLKAALRRIIDERRQGGSALADGGLAMVFATPEQRAVLNRLSGLMSLLEGHGDIVMNRASRDHVPNAERFHQVMHERRQQAKGVNKLMQRLLGIEAKLAQYELGEHFIETIEDRLGSAALDAVWADVSHVPTLEEIKDPERWLERVTPAAAVGG